MPDTTVTKEENPDNQPIFAPFVSFVSIVFELFSPDTREP
jgi:hypothetical protein